MEKTICPVCEEETETEVVVEKVTVVIKGEPITFLNKYLKCKKCGYILPKDYNGIKEELNLAYKEYERKKRSKNVEDK